ncbi:DUF1800 domain-containing protein [Sphingomonas crusticola]|uniref:DUF1800 domain-containing protein n=1 Tax=Sphingomonas crusticola TaxID=1697973 RepID=UPI000E253C55|nr:DUF1800 domain-containing protein [Sphingomonas crusticola]
MSLSNLQAQAIALNRFGLGVRPDDAPPANPKKWLLDQFDRFEVKPAAFAALPPPGSLARAYFQEVGELIKKMGAAAAPAMPAPTPPPAMPPAPPPVAMADDMRAKLQRQERRQALNVEVRDTYRLAVNARMRNALTTDAPFAERLASFWSNHFALSVEKPQVGIYAADFELTAIRPHILGRFEDMLIAVEQHPAMLYYLDQFRSVGPNSPFGARAALRQPNRKTGLNENLAREIMELHTLGVRTGYSQADVTEFARAMTGWSVGGLGPMAAQDNVELGAFMFRSGIHEPGSRAIIGKTYAQSGEAQARAVLHDLATSPATARHISTKLARHFVADDPPPALIDRMSRAFVSSRGGLPAVYRVLIDAPEAWTPGARKFKTPWDWTVSSLRALGRRDLGKMDASSMLNQLGQPIWKPGSPAGYDDLSASWAAPDALMRRVELAQRFAAAAGGQVDARDLAPRLLPGQVTPATAAALAQAESGPTALALLLVSPEFQRR